MYQGTGNRMLGGSGGVDGWVYYFKSGMSG